MKNIDIILAKQIYDETKSFRKTAKYFDVCSDTIINIFKRNNIEYNIPIRYDCDHDFFFKDNEESFYLAGFIAADGCLKQRANHFELFIGLSKHDKDFLEKIKNTLKSNAPIKDYLIKNSKRNIVWNDSWSSQFYITSKKIFDDLARFNIVPRKSLIYTFPEWLKNHELKHHFMRGYSDGDGSFYLSGRNDKIKQLHFYLLGTISFLEQYEVLLRKECDLKEKKIRFFNKIGRLEYGGNFITKKIANYLYKDSTIYLERKYNLVHSSSKM